MFPCRDKEGEAPAARNCFQGKGQKVETSGHPESLTCSWDVIFPHHHAPFEGTQDGVLSLDSLKIDASHSHSSPPPPTKKKINKKEYYLRVKGIAFKEKKNIFFSPFASDK